MKNFKSNSFKLITCLLTLALTTVIALSTSIISFSALAEEYSSSQATVSTTGDIDDIEANAPTGDNTTVALDDTAYSTASVAAVSDYSGYFAGGSGTSTDPYKISTAYQFCCIGKLSTEMVSTYVYYELTTNIYLSDVTFSADGYLSTYFRGSINGKGFTVYSNTSNYVWLSAYSVGTVDIYDINFYQNEGGFVGMIMYSGYYISETGVYDNIITFYKIGIDGIFTANNNLATLTAITFGTLIFEEVTNDADITMTGYAGIFLGGYPYKAEVAYVNCENTGTVYGVYVGFFNGNTNADASTFKYVGSTSSEDGITDYVGYLTSVRNNETEYSDYSDYSIVYVKGCKNNAYLYGSSTCSAFATNINETYNSEANTAVVTVDDLGVAPLLLSKALIDSSAALKAATASIQNNKVVFENYATYLSSYETIISVSTSFSNADGSVGSSYVKIVLTITTENGKMYVDNIEKIIGSSEWNAANPDNTYETLVSEGYTTGTDNYGGSPYVVYGTTIIVDSASLLEIYNTGSAASATTVTCNAAPSYQLNGYYGSNVFSTKTFSYSEILAASTSSTNE